MEQNNLFATALEGDQNINSLKKKAIVIVGTTKAGKSTTHHWLTAKPLKSETKYGRTFYTCLTADGAPIGNQMASQTLVPNTINLNDNVSLVDVAGFADNRDHVGVIGVSYMLRAIFDKVNEIKFIIVIPADKIETIEANYFLTPFKGFFKMFNYGHFSEKLKAKLRESVSILITKTKSPLAQYIEMLKGACDELLDPSLKVDFKKETIQLVTHLIEHKKIEIFPAAVNGVEAKQTRILEQLGEKSWNYLNIEQANEMFNKQLVEEDLAKLKELQKKGFVKLPFLEDYQRLDESEKKKAKNLIDAKISSFKNAAEVLKQFIQKAKSQGNWYKKQIDYKDQFKKLNDFLMEFNVYKQVVVSEEYKTKIIQMKMEITKPNQKINAVHGLELLQKLADIQYNTVMITQRADNNGKKNLMWVWDMIIEALKLSKKLFCRSQQEQSQFMQFTFVLGRGFRELHVLADIHAELASDSYFKIIEDFQIVFSEKVQKLKSLFISQIKDEDRKNLFGTNQQLTSYLNFIKNSLEQNDDKKLTVLLKKQEMIIERTKGQLLLKEQKFKEALRSFVRTSKSLNAYSDQQQRKFEEQYGSTQNQIHQDLKDTRQTIETLKLAIYKSIARSLEAAEQEVDALKFFKYINYSDSAIKMYEKIIVKTPEGQPRMKVLIDFGEYCIKEGRIHQAFEIYQRAYEEAENFNGREKVKKKIQNLKLEKDIQEEKYVRSLQKRKLADNIDPIIDLEEQIELQDSA